MTAYPPKVMGLEVAQVHWGVARRAERRLHITFWTKICVNNMAAGNGNGNGDDERKFALETTFHFILLTGMLKAKKIERVSKQEGVERGRER